MADNEQVTGFPLLLDLAGRPVVVVGGGTVATRRVRSLLQAGARVRVVAPQIADALAQLVESGVDPERPVDLGSSGREVVTIWWDGTAE